MGCLIMSDKIIGEACDHGVFFPPCYQCENQALRDELEAVKAAHKELLKHLDKLFMCCYLDEFEHETSHLIVYHRMKHTNQVEKGQ